MDMTSPEIAALRGPFSQVIGSLLGFSPYDLMQTAAGLPAGGSKKVPFSGGPVLGSGGGFTSGSGDKNSTGGMYDPSMFGGMGGTSPFVSSPNYFNSMDGSQSTGIPGSGFGPMPGSGSAQVGTGFDHLGNNVLGGMPQWMGPFTAGMAPGEAGMLQQLWQNQTGNRPQLLEDTLAGKFLPGQEGANPFLEAAITAAQRPTMQNLEETLSRTLPGRFNMAGQTTVPQGSSAFDRHAATAARDAQQTMADIGTQMSFGVHEGERGRQMEAIKLSQGEVDTMIKNLQAQALPRLIEDLGIERGMAEFQGRISNLLNVLGVMTGAPMMNLGQQSQSQSSQFSFGLPSFG
jgi:hypothetical protein